MENKPLLHISPPYMVLPEGQGTNATVLLKNLPAGKMLGAKRGGKVTAAGARQIYS
jgi:hypothetical protein